MKKIILIFVLLLTLLVPILALASIPTLGVPQNLSLSNDGIASWDVVENTSLYGLYGGIRNPNNNAAEYTYCILIDDYTVNNGRATSDISAWLQVACDRLGYTTGKVYASFKLCSYTSDMTKYKSSEQSVASNEIEFTVNSIPTLGVPQNLKLSNDGIASWDVVENTKLYGLYGGVRNPNNNTAEYTYCILIDDYTVNNGRATTNISAWLQVACDRLGYTTGKVYASFKLYSYTSDMSKYNSSEQSLASNEIEFDIDNPPSVHADILIETSFPDENFREYVSETIDINKDGKLSKDEIANVSEISCASKRISSLKGIELFTNLITLECTNNRIKELDLSSNNQLLYLGCSENKLETLNISNAVLLKSISCSNNKLTILDISNNTYVETLYCSDNNLTSLITKNNPHLKTLGCNNNELTSVELSDNTELTTLYLRYNKLSSLVLSNNTQLVDVDCPGNELSFIDLSNCPKLRQLNCERNHLSTIDLSKNAALVSIYISDNELSDLDVSNCEKLSCLRCDNNNISTIEIAKNSLDELYCTHNRIKSLDLTNQEYLTILWCGSGKLETLILANPELAILDCEGNYIEVLDIRKCPHLVNCIKNAEPEFTSREGPLNTWSYDGVLSVRHGMQILYDDNSIYCGHDLEKHDRIEPTETKSGTEAYWVCKHWECKKLFSDEECKNEIAEPVIIPKLEPADKVEAFVTRCYKLILNRDADEGGLQGWSDALTSKTATAAQIIDGFVRSQEFTNRNLGNDAAVDILYNTMLDRAADAGGKAGWVDALNKGYTLQNIIDGFCGSPEFKAICDSFGIEPGSVGAATPADTSTPRGKIEAFVKRCYKLILSRDADEGGLKGWSDALETRTAAAAQIIDGFVRSEEYTNRKLSAGESVDILYKTMLDRNADEGGRAGWVDALGQGYTLQHIINGFCGSAEFTAICNNYGIVAGSVAVSGAVVKREAITPEGDEAEAPVVYQGYNSEFINEEKIRAFVEHCYVAVFGREGDAEGVENYTKLILDGKKMPKKVAYEFIFSPEFQNQMPGNEEFIRILYRLYFDREPGAEELSGWVQMLEGGTSLEEIVNGFAGSAEFKAIVTAMKE